MAIIHLNPNKYKRVKTTILAKLTWICREILLRDRMIPRHQNRRLMQITGFGLLAVIGSWLIFSALSDNLQLFYDPSEIVADGFVPESNEIKIGGLVVPGSVQKDDGITTTFSISDFPKEGETVKPGLVVVSYQGVLPDLFSEGEGVVVTGQLTGLAELKAREVLAKHDENYQPVK